MNPTDTQLTTTEPRTIAANPSGPSSRGLQLTSYDEMKRFATDVANSGLAPRDLKTPEAIMIAMQHGMELGLSPAQSLQSIAVINGRPSLWGDAALALVKSHPECDDVIETFEKDGEEGVTAICEILRRGKQPVKRKFNVAMAKKAGLWGKAGPWTQYPMRMLQMRARSWAMRDAFPDALKGVGMAEEVRDIQRAEPRQIEAVVLPGDEPETPKLTNIEVIDARPGVNDLADRDLF